MSSTMCLSLFVGSAQLQTIISLKQFNHCNHVHHPLLHRSIAHSRAKHVSRCRHLVVRSEKTKSTISVPTMNEGLALLLGVSFLWGSYTPALRALFTQPDAPMPIFVAAARGIMQVGLLGAATSLGVGGSDGAKTSSGPAGNELANVVQGSLEIGTYNTMGTLLQTWGLSMTTATRGAFLIQATALFTPFLATLFGIYPSRTLWISSFIAFLATVLVAADQVGPAAILAADGSSTGILGSAFSTGDAATLGAAFCYSMATVRIPTYTKLVSPLRLAFGKSAVLATVSTSVVAWHVLTPTLTGLAPATDDLWPGAWSNPLVWGILVWSAVGPGALASYCHVKGQSLVGPTEAQVVFSAVPLWSGVLAAVLVPGEHVGGLTWLGGAGMVVAGLVAAVPKKGWGSDKNS